VGTVLVVDRSLAYPDSPTELYELRRLAVAELCRRLGPETTASVTYAEKACEASLEDAAASEFEYVFGANLSHALVLAGRHDVARIIVVTYSLPNAHHTSPTDVCVMFPAMPKSLERALVEARRCAEHGIRIDVALILRSSTAAPEAEPEAELEPEIREPEPELELTSDATVRRVVGVRRVEATPPSYRDLMAFFRPLTALTGGSVVSVHQPDDIADEVERLLAQTSSSRPTQQPCGSRSLRSRAERPIL
jgi:hypothetical protein